MLPKKGKVFPANTGTNGTYAEQIAAALRNDLGASHQGVKTAMRWTGASERTVKNWFAGTNGPSGEHLVYLARHSKAVMGMFLVLTGHSEMIAGLALEEIRTALVDALTVVDMHMADA